MQSSIVIRIKSASNQDLTNYNFFICKLIEYVGIQYRIVNMPKRRRRVTLLRSPHVYKKSKEQFEFRLHTTSIFLKGNLDLIKLKTILYNPPKSVLISISKR
jgi:ribosomal protein S10